MGKSHALVLIQIAFVTVLQISSCEGSSDHVAVVLDKTKNDCRAPKTVNVAFWEIKIKNNDADVVYQRFRMESRQEIFASNNSAQQADLECENLSQCGKAAARAGFDAFKFSPSDDSWIGYKLHQPLLKCGDFATEESEIIYVLPEFFVYEPTVVPFDEAPHITTDLGSVREYRLSTFIPDSPENQVIDRDTLTESMARTNNLVFDPRGDLYSTPMAALDLNHCLNDGAYGFRIYVATVLYDATLPVVYFFNECGKTIKLSKELPSMPLVAIYSHPGLGCTYYPNDLPDECTVTFEGPDNYYTIARFYYPSFESEDECGLNMTIIGSPGQDDEEVKNTCDPSGKVVVNNRFKYTFSLGSHPSKQAYGFYADIISS